MGVVKELLEPAVIFKRDVFENVHREFEQRLHHYLTNNEPRFAHLLYLY